MHGDTNIAIYRQETMAVDGMDGGMDPWMAWSEPKLSNPQQAGPRQGLLSKALRDVENSLSRIPRLPTPASRLVELELDIR